MILRSIVSVALLGGAMASPLLAQERPLLGVELNSDENRRGLSWSGGRLSPSADIFASQGPIEASGRIVALRDSARHGGADVVGDLSLGASTLVGPVTLRGRVTGHLFGGAGFDADYVELGGSAAYTLGPVQVDAGADYAPSQSAIGGDNLYLHAGAQTGIPGTPWTVLAGIGRSTGTTDDPARAARLRPGGEYTDWRLGVEHITGPVTLGLDYVGTDVSERAASIYPLADARHAGDRIVGRVRFGF
ncbi:TorF family putative porin [uncultured Sphingomonas sp.]|uniref:TorF family putative porin n=1 Tax=uncultured Sphingomonas sp. TaxID=158754 RepID=UPI002600F229|nr:TorF family putative porin [uncultured Sphingomonas sp.]